MSGGIDQTELQRINRQWSVAVFCFLIMAASGWWLATHLAFRLHFANDTIRLLRANASTLTADERDAVEVAAEILEAGVVPKILRPHMTKTLRDLLERTGGER